MIKGMGTDIVEIARIDRMVKKYGSQFLNKVFTDNEINLCSKKAFPSIHLSGRWAAKEAFYKALPSDIQVISGWKSIEIISGQNGRRQVMVIDRTLMRELEHQKVEKINISISHEREYCVAVILLE
jgi:holo-[acyl-carrier protein] synthase